MRTIYNRIFFAITAIFVTAVLCGVSLADRRIEVGAPMPQFSGEDASQKPFEYKSDSGKVLLVLFVSPGQERSLKAVNDIKRIVSELPEEKVKDLQAAIIIEDVNGDDFVASIQKDAPAAVRILRDEKYHIWGMFGVIATPTMAISDSKGKVLSVKPGYSYNFAPVVKASLYKALDIPLDSKNGDVSKVQVVSNTGISAKARRHLQMAKILLAKGSVSSAVLQAKAAYDVDPNSIEVAVEFGELLCQTGKAEEAVKLISSISVTSHRDKARIGLILGSANRQMDKLDEAEKILIGAAKDDPKSDRILFELGQVYQKRNETEKAMNAYYKALKLLYKEK